MKLVGVSGFIGSGKTTLLKYVKTMKNVLIIEADEIAREFLYHKDVVRFIENNVSEAIKDNIIDKSILRIIVFNNTFLNNQFTSLMWPLISNKIKTIVSNNMDKDMIVVEAAMINGIDMKFDKKILLKKKWTKRFSDTLKRDKRGMNEFKKITKYQKEQLKNCEFDYVIKNNYNISQFHKQIKKIIDEILMS